MNVNGECEMKYSKMLFETDSKEVGGSSYTVIFLLDSEPTYKFHHYY